MSAEKERLKHHVTPELKGPVPIWEKWGPYVAERAWGTVREDYSENGDAWNYFPHEHARMRTYRRSEDGIAGISDRFQVLLFAPAFWNGADPILKERLFGLNAWEGNHGEDVKEIYYYLDGTPTHSYLKYLYKYPQKAFPYEQLIEENRNRSARDREFELIDTGIFDENRYFDIFVEYAKAGPEDICIKIEAFNRGPQSAPLHILPHLWFRNEWSWGIARGAEPVITTLAGKEFGLVADDRNLNTPKYLLFDYHLGRRTLYAPKGASPLFTNNDSNKKALWDVPNDTPYVKDAFHRHLIGKEKGAVNPEPYGTKAALHYFFPAIEPGKSVVLYFRLTDKTMDNPLGEAEKIIQQRKAEADAFYAEVHPKKATEEEKMIQRQALAGMVWNKQIYIFDVGTWLQGDPKIPPPESHRWIRNFHWRHITSMRVFSMPDKWEYPWFAAWDLTFHTLSFALIDIEFAKHQLWLLLFDQFQHPNGAIPAYEWEFSDVNPPVQAWAALKIFELEKRLTGKEDFNFLEKCFHKLLLNFAWWVNKVDSLGNNVFEGGFLGMDNVGFTDRSQKLPPGYLLDQSDGAGWISLLCLNLMRISLTLARQDRIYEGLGIKFFQHFLFVTAAMRKGYWRPYDMWDEEDGFFYSHKRNPDGTSEKLPVRSLVGIIPFFACDVWDENELKSFPEFYESYLWMMEKRSNLTDKCIQSIPHESGTKHLFGLLNAHEIELFLKKNIWNPNEFRSEHGLRSLSKYHEKNPVRMHGFTMGYEPGEALEKIKGGNSNWRGPIWFPLNYFLIDTLSRLGAVFNDNLKVQTGKEAPVNLNQMAESFANRLLSLFALDKNGRRPCLGDAEKFQKDPHFRDHPLFYEHFHGDNGRGLGASHQNGWTGLIANLIDEFRK